MHDLPALLVGELGLGLGLGGGKGGGKGGDNDSDYNAEDEQKEAKRLREVQRRRQAIEKGAF